MHYKDTMDHQKLVIIKDIAEKNAINTENTPKIAFSDKKTRIGKILDQINEKNDPKTYKIGNSILDTTQDTFKNNQKTIQLTEKETALLATLAKAQGSPINRKELLDHIWNYAENIETHTLETHIYRLRQKIENDPTNPQIILTHEDGYKLGKTIED